MIHVTYHPSGPSPFPDPSSNTHTFADAASFYDWVQGYTCAYCLHAFYEDQGKLPKSLADWLHWGCGFEIDVTDDDNIIDWDHPMTLPDDFSV